MILILSYSLLALQAFNLEKGNENMKQSQNRPLIGIGVLVFDVKGRLLLCQRKNTHGDGSWSPSGGHLEFGESLEACARRETEEEVGLQIDKLCFVGLTNDIFENEGKHYVSLFFSTVYDGIQPIIVGEPEKIAAINWFPLDALPKNLFLPLKQFVDQHSLQAIYALVVAQAGYPQKMNPLSCSVDIS